MRVHKELDRSAHLGRSLLGSDAFVETGRARRVHPSKTKKKSQGPLLNCTSESRRRAQAGNGTVAPKGVGEDAPDQERAWVASAVGVMAFACAVRLGGLARFVATLVSLASAFRFFFPKARKKPRKPAPAPRPCGELAECWATSECAPPLPLLELPKGVEDVREDWMSAASVAPRWSARERRFLARARREFASELADVPPYLDAYGDRRFLRFLRMDPNLDEDRAIHKVGAYLRWRRERRADDMRALVPERGREPRNWPHGDVLMDCIRVLQCSERYYSTRGHAVTVYQAFHWPAPALRAKVGGMTTKQLVDFATFGAEYNSVQMEKISVSRERVLVDHAKRLFDEGELADDRSPLLSEGWGELTRLCAITDMAGCTFGSMMMPQLLPAVVQAVSTFVNYYPYIVGELHVINCAPLVAKVFKRALRTVVPKHIADQVQVHVHASELLDSVRPHNLPVQIGGAADCDELVPPPPPPADFDARAPREKEDDDAPPPHDRADILDDDGAESAAVPTSPPRTSPPPKLSRRLKSAPANLLEAGNDHPTVDPIDHPTRHAKTAASDAAALPPRSSHLSPPL
ncbi:hypothetical protein CTAYLR_000322 [Chrysophaeum taylorii]|uniref:CRAL-TRIO domain-containing protein n=1 Tax=Chrysophaeum taylorii TaxID=2483200 RepID=A0AAD7UFU7_9STRA|nr:hypothetical protein CTAYLR_000322 [Chrysophaeum taylorii]